MQTTTAEPRGSRWVPPLVAAVAIPTFTAFWAGGHPQLGAAWAGVSVVFGLLLALGGRSDTIRMLRGDEDDERTLALEYEATTIAAVVLLVALLGLFLAAGVRGESGLVYAALILLAELTHIGALSVLSRRR